MVQDGRIVSMKGEQEGRCVRSIDWRHCWWLSVTIITP